MYDKLQESLAIQSLKAAKVGLHKANQFLHDIDLKETDKNGRPIYKVKEIDDSLKSLYDRMIALEKVEVEVRKRVESNIESQGSLEPAFFEDGIPD